MKSYPLFVLMHNPQRDPNQLLTALSDPMKVSKLISHYKIILVIFIIIDDIFNITDKLNVIFKTRYHFYSDHAWNQSSSFRLREIYPHYYCSFTHNFSYACLYISLHQFIMYIRQAFRLNNIDPLSYHFHLAVA